MVVNSVFSRAVRRTENPEDQSLCDHLWLADSGASIHLIAQRLLDSGHVAVVAEDEYQVRCSLASGEVLSLNRRVTVRAQFLTVEGRLVCAELRGLVTECEHSLLSLGSLATKGWTININSEGLSVRRSRCQLYTCWFSNVGWLVTRSLETTRRPHGVAGAAQLQLRGGEPRGPPEGLRGPGREERAPEGLGEAGSGQQRAPEGFGCLRRELRGASCEGLERGERGRDPRCGDGQAGGSENTGRSCGRDRGGGRGAHGEEFRSLEGGPQAEASYESHAKGLETHSQGDAEEETTSEGNAGKDLEGQREAGKQAEEGASHEQLVDGAPGGKDGALNEMPCTATAGADQGRAVESASTSACSQPKAREQVLALRATKAPAGAVNRDTFSPQKPGIKAAWEALCSTGTEKRNERCMVDLCDLVEVLASLGDEGEETERGEGESEHDVWWILKDRLCWMVFV